MANITSYINLIKSAVFGEEVRDAIINALKKMNTESSGAKETALSFEDRTTALENAKNTMNNRLNAMTTDVAAALDASVVAFEKATDIEALLDELTSTVSMKVDDIEVIDGDMYLLSNGERVAGPYSGFGGGGSGPGGSTGNNAVMSASNASGWTSKTVAQGADCLFTLNWSSIESELATGNGTMKILVNGATAGTRDVQQGSVEINLTPYLAIGSNSIRLQVSDVYGNSKTLVLTVKVMAVSLTSTFDSAGTFNDAIAFTYVPTGALAKTVIFKIDGVQKGTQTVNTSGRQQTYYIPQQAHGSHSLEVYFTAEVDGQTIESNHLFYDLICVKPGNYSPIVAIDFNATTVNQYTSIVIPYSVYDPSDLTAEITLKAGDDVVNSLTVDRTRQYWTYRANMAGSLTLTITCGEVSKSITMTVKEANIDAKAETNDLALYLSSYGRSNAEKNPAIWKHGRTAATFTGFNWTSDGWQTDEDGITVMRVAGDARLTIPFQIFAEDFRTSGKTIEVEFTTRDVRDYDAAILSCMSGGRGIELTAQLAKLKSEQSEISMQYKDGAHLRISFVVEKRAKNRLIYCYVDGIISGVVQYPSDDDFAQTSPVGISIGSSLCTTDIYCIRVYDNDLTKEQMLNNWIADTQNGALMLERYGHNAVYDEYGKIVISALPKDLPYLILEGPALPQYKGNKLTVSGQYVDPTNSSRSFTFENAQIDVQGTSSQYYARKNYKLKFKNGLTGSSGKVDAYALRPGAVPVDTFCFKADVASSEGCNNVELVRLFDETSPYKTPPQKTDARIRQGIDGFPIVIFWNNGDETVFVGKYNFNNDKSTEPVFGFQEGDESWETLNNTSNRVLFKDSDFSGSSWTGDFEARYPDGSTDVTRLAAFAAWVKSTDGNGVKFKNELETWCDKDSAIFYWLFTELFLMVDSRAKNSFPTRFNSEGKWVWIPYDFDTALGINNEGVLAFGYSLEDTDHLESGADVFNGQNSVFWTNLRSQFGPDIATMYQNLRSTGAISYEKVLAMFDQHQAKWPEAVFNEDAQFKYLDPLITGGDAGYLSMLQGSKKSQRDWWLYNRMRYMDSKYNAGDDRTDTITLRGYAKADVTVTPYADLYCNIKYGSYLVSTRGQRNHPYTLACPLSNVNDTEIYIYSASRLASVGDLSGLKVGYAEFSNASKLQDLKLGDASSSYTNANLTELHLGNNVLLKTIDCRNCTSLGTGSMATVDVSGCSNIEEIYMEGTKITGINLPNGGQLKKLHLPSTITNLTIRNQRKLTDLTIPSYAGISTLRIENSSVDALAILNAIAANSRVRIIGFEMEMDTAQEVLGFFDKLDTFRGLDENGNNVDKPQMSGSIHIPTATGAQLTEFVERYPGIKVNTDPFTFTVKYYTWDGSTLLHTETVQDGGDATYSGTPSRPSTAQYTFTFAGWARDLNGVVWADAKKAVRTDRVLYAAYTATEQKYTVRFYNGSTLLQTVSNVLYGGSAYYSGNTAELVDPDGSGMPFEAWVPSPSNIKGNLSVYATYESPVEVKEKEIEDDWDTILANVENGTYREVYSIGNYKALDLGTEGVINMQIIAFDRDQKADGSGAAPITWLSKELLKTSKVWNPNGYSEGSPEVKYSGTNKWIEENGVYKSNCKNISDGISQGFWKITASAATTLTVNWTTDSENDYDKLLVYVGTTKKGEWSGEGESGSFTEAMTAGQELTIFGQYAKDGSNDTGTDTVTLAFSGDNITVEQIDTETNIAPMKPCSGGTLGGWENCQLRTYYKETLKPLIPETVRNKIVPVTKTQYACRQKTGQENTSEVFIQTSTEDVWCPSYAEMYQSTSNGGIYRSIFTDNALRKKFKVGASDASWWWLRSAYGSYNAYYVYSDGSNSYYYVYNSRALALGFCF